MAAPAALAMTGAEKFAAGGKVAGGTGKLIGGLANIYGTYQGVQMAEKQFAEDKRRYEDQVERMKMMDAMSQNQMNLGNLGQFQQLAMGQEDRIQDTYGNYNRMIGR